ncbi:MAG: VOC family protein [Deltaproteobacteria bacterium]|nr:VOC family protein [Deltaproteobacteria bacterium]
MKFHHAAVIARSEDNADQFYEGILQLKKIKTAFLTRELAKDLFDAELECPFMLYGNDTCAIEVFVIDQLSHNPAPCVHLCLEVEDREDFLESCRSHGLKITRVPKGDSQVCFIQDFDGNRFEIKAQQ